MNRFEKRRQQKLAKKTAARTKPESPVSPARHQQARPANQQQTHPARQAMNMAVQHFSAGDLEKAEGICQQIVRAEPNHPVALHLLGVIAHKLDKNDIAVDLIGKAVAINPDIAEAHHNLGSVLHKLGRLDEAVASFHKSLAISPHYAMAHGSLGNTLMEQGNQGEAFNSFRRAVSHDPQNENYWAGLAASLNGLVFSSADDGLLRDLLNLLNRHAVRPSSLVHPVISALYHHQGGSRLFARLAPEAPENDSDASDAAEQLSAITLFLRLMELTIINDLKIERMLTKLRDRLLRQVIAGTMHDKGLPFLAALALQCFTNEYVFAETNEERGAVEHLEQQIAQRVEQNQDVSPTLIAALGAYRPLHGFEWAEKLVDRPWSGPATAMIERQITEPLIEQSLRATAACITPVDDTVSQSVRAQYEENPYPRWIKADLTAEGRPIGDVLQGPPLSL
jgi:tetratricopeptide (TPR) repeat protein